MPSFHLTKSQDACVWDDQILILDHPSNGTPGHASNGISCIFPQIFVHNIPSMRNNDNLFLDIDQVSVMHLKAVVIPHAGRQAHSPSPAYFPSSREGAFGPIHSNSEASFPFSSAFHSSAAPCYRPTTCRARQLLLQGSHRP